MSLIVQGYNNDGFYEDLIAYLKNIGIIKFEIIEYKGLVYIPYESLLEYFSIDAEAFKKSLIKKKEYVGYNGSYYINKYGSVKLLNYIILKKEAKFDTSNVIPDLQDKLLMFMYNKEINGVINSYMERINEDSEIKNKQIKDLITESQSLFIENNQLENELENVKVELDSAIEKNNSLIENLRLLEESIKKKSKPEINDSIIEARSNVISKKKQEKKIIHLLRKKIADDFNIFTWITKETLDNEFIEMSKEYLLDELSEFPYDYVYYMTLSLTEEKIKYLNFMLDINSYSVDIVIKLINL
jgi:hypothetical protein